MNTTMAKKAVTSRIKITKKGKLMRRKMGLSHFRAKKSGTQLNRKAKSVLVNTNDLRMFKKYL